MATVIDFTTDYQTCNEHDTFHLCPKFTKIFSILGKKWNGLIIDVLLENGHQRFKDIANYIPECSDRVLVERLKELEREGLIQRQTFPNSSLIQYRLTERGNDLRAAIEAVHGWADKWLDIKECKD